MHSDLFHKPQRALCCVTPSFKHKGIDAVRSGAIGSVRPGCSVRPQFTNIQTDMFAGDHKDRDLNEAARDIKAQKESRPSKND